MSRNEQNRNLYKHAYEEIQASSELKERLFDMKFTQRSHMEQRRTSLAIRTAVAVVVIALFGCTTVYAAGQIGLFSTLFGDSDMSPVTEYIETVGEDNGGAYQAENDEWLVTVEQFLYNEATDYGIVQFTVTDKTGNGGQWYGMAVRESLYESWEMPAVQEIYSDTLGFMVSDNTGFYNDRLFVVDADENTTRCQMAFKCLDDTDMKNQQPQVTVYEREGDEMNEIMRLDVPMCKSLPYYCWRNADGEERLLLSSVDFLLCDAPEASYCGNDIIAAEVSVQMKDGSSYVILSDSEKICHKFFGTLTEAGLWNCFDRVIDLADIVSFTVDGEVFYVENAVIE